MPFKSEKQRRYLWKNEPAIAKRWSKEYGSMPVDRSPKKAKQELSKNAIERRLRKKSATPMAKSNSKGYPGLKKTHRGY